MTNADQAYDDLIEISARTIAFRNLTGQALPRRVHELISEAADLRGAWDKYSGEGTPGSANLPMLDAVIDEVYLRANSLCCEIFGEVRYAGTTDFRYTSTTDFRYTGTTDLSGLAAQMREQLGRVIRPHHPAPRRYRDADAA